MQDACDKCKKDNFKSAQCLREHKIRCEWCPNCQSFRGKSHVSRCKVDKARTKRCEVCFKWLQKSYMPRHVRAHESQLQLDQVNIVLSIMMLRVWYLLPYLYWYFNSFLVCSFPTQLKI